MGSRGEGVLWLQRRGGKWRAMSARMREVGGVVDVVKQRTGSADGMGVGKDREGSSERIAWVRGAG